MSRPQPSVAYGTYATRFLIALAILLAGLAGGNASADSGQAVVPTAPMVVRIVDGDGRAQYPATAVACPYVGATFDCYHPVTAQVGPAGLAVLQLDRAVRYHVIGVVRNPSPAWACPGTLFNGAMFYISPEAFDGTPRELPGFARFTVDEPDPGDCVTVTVTDDSGNPLEGAGLLVDDGFGNGLTDADGHVSLDVEPGVGYELGAFIANTGWPCPWVGGDGTPLHIVDKRPVSAEELLAGVTLVIRKPDPSECAPPPPPGTAAEIRIFDEAHNSLPHAFLGICQYDPATPPTYPPPAVTVCDPATWWAGSNGTGVIHIEVDPDLMYDITGFLSCVDGWYLFASGNYTQSGYEVWRVSGAELLTNGLEMTIRGDIATCVGS